MFCCCKFYILLFIIQLYITMNNHHLRFEAISGSNPSKKHTQTIHKRYQSRHGVICMLQLHVCAVDHLE